MSAFVEGTIILQNGKELNGLVLFAGPQSMYAKSIKFKKSKKGDTQKFDSEEVKYIVVTSMENPLVFEYSFYNEFSLKKEKKTKYKSWNRLISNCEELNVYVSNQFSFNKRGEMFILYDERLGQNTFLFKRPGEEIPSQVGTTRDGNVVASGASAKQTQKLAQYFKDNSTLVSKIEKNKWDVRDFAAICDEYCGAE